MAEAHPEVRGALGQYATSTDSEGFAHKSAVLEQHCKDVGRDSPRSRSANYNVVIGENAAEVADKLDWIEAHYAKVLPHKAGRSVASSSAVPSWARPSRSSRSSTSCTAAG